MPYDINVPDFYTDPYYKKSQEELFPLGAGILKGEIPEYYEEIGEFGGEAFEGMLDLLQRDVSKGVTEDLARRKVRGARGSDIVSKAMGDISTKLRWEDYRKSIEGKKFLFSGGKAITEGVRSAGLSFGGQKNQFNLQKAGLEFDIEKQEEASKQAEDAMWSDIFSSVIGAAGTVAGMGMLGSASKATKVLGNVAGGGNPLSNAGGNLNFKDFMKYM